MDTDSGLHGLLWTIAECEGNQCGTVLCSSRGRDVLSACGVTSETFWCGSLLRLGVAPAGLYAYATTLVDSVKCDPQSGKVMEVRVIAFSKTKGCRISKKLKDLDQQRAPITQCKRADAAAVHSAVKSAEQLGLTEHDLKAASLRMQLLIPLTDLSRIEKELEEMPADGPTYVDAHHSIDQLNKQISALIAAYKQHMQQHNSSSSMLPCPEELRQNMQQLTAPAAQLSAAKPVLPLQKMTDNMLPQQPAPPIAVVREPSSHTVNYPAIMHFETTIEAHETSPVELLQQRPAAAGGRFASDASAVAAEPSRSNTTAAAAAATHKQQLEQQQRLSKFSDERQMADAAPGHRCQLCSTDASTLVWSGQVTWRSTAGLLAGTFTACGHLYPPSIPPAPAQSSPATNSGISSSSSRGYWRRYQQLPQQLDFVVDTPASSFMADVWNKPPANPASGIQAGGGAAGDIRSMAALSAGWDLAPLVLVPRSKQDSKSLSHLMNMLRSTGKSSALMASGQFKVSYSPPQIQQQQQQQHLTGHSFISYSPNGPLLDLLQQQLPAHCRRQWGASSTVHNAFSAKGLLYDAVHPVCVLATSWWRGCSAISSSGAAVSCQQAAGVEASPSLACVPDPPAGLQPALAAAAAGALQLKQQSKNELQLLQAAGWQLRTAKHPCHQQLSRPQIQQQQQRWQQLRQQQQQNTVAEHLPHQLLQVQKSVQGPPAGSISEQQLAKPVPCLAATAPVTANTKQHASPEQVRALADGTIHSQSTPAAAVAGSTAGLRLSQQPHSAVGNCHPSSGNPAQAPAERMRYAGPEPPAAQAKVPPQPVTQLASNELVRKAVEPRSLQTTAELRSPVELAATGTALPAADASCTVYAWASVASKAGTAAKEPGTGEVAAAMALQSVAKTAKNVSAAGRVARHSRQYSAAAAPTDCMASAAAEAAAAAKDGVVTLAAYAGLATERQHLEGLGGSALPAYGSRSRSGSPPVGGKRRRSRLSCTSSSRSRNPGRNRSTTRSSSFPTPSQSNSMLRRSRGRSRGQAGRSTSPASRGASRAVTAAAETAAKRSVALSAYADLATERQHLEASGGSGLPECDGRSGSLSAPVGRRRGHGRVTCPSINRRMTAATSSHTSRGNSKPRSSSRGRPASRGRARLASAGSCTSSSQSRSRTRSNSFTASSESRSRSRGLFATRSRSISPVSRGRRRTASAAERAAAAAKHSVDLAAGKCPATERQHLEALGGNVLTAYGGRSSSRSPPPGRKGCRSRLTRTSSSRSMTAGSSRSRGGSISRSRGMNRSRSFTTLSRSRRGRSRGSGRSTSRSDTRSRSSISCSRRSQSGCRNRSRSSRGRRRSTSNSIHRSRSRSWAPSAGKCSTDGAPSGRIRGRYRRRYQSRGRTPSRSASRSRSRTRSRSRGRHATTKAQKRHRYRSWSRGGSSSEGSDFLQQAYANRGRPRARPSSISPVRPIRSRSTCAHAADTARLLRQLNPAQLSSEEQDELRSAALLHVFAAAVLHQSPGMQTPAQHLFIVGGRLIQLELACQPLDILEAAIPVEQLQLPPNLAPAGCSVADFIRSPRCTLLEILAGGYVKVAGSYMRLVRRHKLLQRLVLQLLSDMRTSFSDRPIPLDYLEGLLLLPRYSMLMVYCKMYRSERRNTGALNFVADNVSGGSEVLLRLPSGFVLVQRHALVPGNSVIVYKAPRHCGVTRGYDANGDFGWLAQPGMPAVATKQPPAPSPPPPLIPPPPPPLQPLASRPAVVPVAAAAAAVTHSTGNPQSGQPVAAGALQRAAAEPVLITDLQATDSEDTNKCNSRGDEQVKDETRASSKQYSKSRCLEDTSCKNRQEGGKLGHVGSSRTTAGNQSSKDRDWLTEYIRQQQQQQTHLQLPIKCRQALQDVSLTELSSQARDEVRSVALLHTFAAVVLDRQGVPPSDRPAIAVMSDTHWAVTAAKVSLKELVLHSHLMPSNCSLKKFISGRCSALRLAGDDFAEVQPRYMDNIRRHQLPQLLLAQLLQELDKKPRQGYLDSSDIGSHMATVKRYASLQLYRQLYTSQTQFLLDTIPAVNQGSHVLMMLDEHMHQRVMVVAAEESAAAQQMGYRKLV